MRTDTPFLGAVLNAVTRGHLHNGEPKGEFDRITDIDTYVAKPAEGKANGNIILYVCLLAHVATQRTHYQTATFPMSLASSPTGKFREIQSLLLVVVLTGVAIDYVCALPAYNCSRQRLTSLAYAVVCDAFAEAGYTTIGIDYFEGVSYSTVLTILRC